MPSKEWRKKNPERQKALAKIARARRWDRIKNDPELKAKANARARIWYSLPENRAKQLVRQSKRWNESSDFRQYKRNKNLMKTYGITLQQKEALLLSQGGKCAICGEMKYNEVTSWRVDHCHKTKEIRGILCNHCNLMIGHARDNPAILLAAIVYLKR